MRVTPASATPAVSGGSGSRRRWVRLLPWLVMVIVAGAVVWSSAGGSGGGSALDPASAAPGGTRALALLAGRLGAMVDTSGALPPVDHGVVVILDDRLTATARSGVLAWVRSGGTLVVADPSSDLAGVAHAEGSSPNSGVVASGPLSPGCGAPWVAGVDQVDTAGAALLAAPPGAASTCFGVGDAYFAVERRQGSGVVISLASPDLWTNKYLGSDANSVLAANLLAPRSGTTLAWLTGPVVGGGNESLTELIPARVDEMLIGIMIALVVVALWRGRRLGRPVREVDPVVVPGSELVGAVGRLLARNHRRDHAADLLRRELRHQVGSRMGVAPGTDPDVVAAMVAARTGRDVAVVGEMMYGSAPDDDAQLIDLARTVEEIRQEVCGVRS